MTKSSFPIQKKNIPPHPIPLPTQTPPPPLHSSPSLKKIHSREIQATTVAQDLPRFASRITVVDYCGANPKVLFRGSALKEKLVCIIFFYFFFIFFFFFFLFPPPPPPFPFFPFFLFSFLPFFLSPFLPFSLFLFPLSHIFFRRTESCYQSC